ncbi:D-tyrosyl-tRNA(Tyr) deacylase [Macleaya cordata]|uniref:D-aminoacyl-tRNA deacylase n=1 Tax=Macleaya cordata TaxID=56857 RepID=A0A200QKW2_MACCD|nr:D-tyrosyl-tRNA(Tyr) deacylase [Macleaya cordata]
MECKDEVKIKIEKSEVIDDDHNIENEKPAKRTRCASTRPSRNIRSSNVRMEHRRRLNRLLSKLIRQHNWKEASGVASVLLKGTCKERSPAKNRNKYWAAMELLNNVDNKQSNLPKVKNIYEIWMRRNGTKDKYLIQMEFYLYCLTHGSPEVAAMAIPLLMTEKEFESEPVSNMLLGLMYYQIWYLSIPEELRLRNFDTYDTPTISEISGMKSYNPYENSDGHNSGDVRDVESIQYDSDTSIGNNKKLDMGIDDVLHRKVTNQLSQPQGFYMEESAGMSGNEEVPFSNHGGNFMNTSIFHSRGLHTSLLPMRLPNSNENLENSIYLHRGMFNYDYDKAVKHLRSALYSTPPLLASLLPLIQLLLLGDQVKEALEELEKLCQRSNATLPLRLRTIILEGFHSKNSTVLSTCYEDILKKDPTCSHSLTNLITMHKNGYYSLEPLLEMIALHLDATYASHGVWGELASCFLKLSQYEEDQMSVNENANEGGGKQVLSSMVPNVFIQRRLGKLWRVRCRWWSSRHFSENAYLSEMQAGDMELLTFKAACASHLYGPESEKGTTSSRTSTSGRERKGSERKRGQRQIIKSMRAIVQRVASASVEVEGRTISEIGPGLLVLVGLHDSDVDSDADYISYLFFINFFLYKIKNKKKCQNGKCYVNTESAMVVFAVSQFTLYGVLKGNKPDFHVAMPPQRAKPFYASVVDKFQKSYKPDAIKGTHSIQLETLHVNLVNDGPVTMQLDSSQPSKNTSEPAEGEP